MKKIAIFIFLTFSFIVIGQNSTDKNMNNCEKQYFKIFNNSNEIQRLIFKLELLKKEHSPDINLINEIIMSIQATALVIMTQIYVTNDFCELPDRIKDIRKYVEDILQVKPIEQRKVPKPQVLQKESV